MNDSSRRLSLPLRLCWTKPECQGIFVIAANMVANAMLSPPPLMATTIGQLEKDNLRHIEDNLDRCKISRS